MWDIYCDFNELTSVFSLRLRTNHYAFSTSNDLELLMQGLKKIVLKYGTEEYYVDMLRNSGLIKVFDYDTKEEDYLTNKYSWQERQELVDLTVKEALELREQRRREKKQVLINSRKRLSERQKKVVLTKETSGKEEPRDFKPKVLIRRTPRLKKH